MRCIPTPTNNLDNERRMCITQLSAIGWGKLFTISHNHNPIPNYPGCTEIQAAIWILARLMRILAKRWAVARVIFRFNSMRKTECRRSLRRA